MQASSRRCGLVMRALVIAATLAWPGAAVADVTAFLGLSPTPTTRPARGGALGMGLVVVGFEVEVAQIVADVDDDGPSLTTGSVNVLLQTPVEVSGLQFYATTGGTLYRETLDAATGRARETHVGGNLGGGIKLRIAGPLKLRADYRVFRLRGTPRHDTYHRVYAGATLGF